jgi:hypothetical protein
VTGQSLRILEVMVAEHVLRVLLSELGTVRLACAHCQTVTETPALKLDKHGGGLWKCPLCEQPFYRNGRPDWLAKLGEAFREVEGMTDLFKVEFAVRTDAPAKP